MTYKPQVISLLNGSRSNVEQTFSSSGVNGISDLVQKYEGMRSAQELILATLLVEVGKSSQESIVIANKMAEAYGNREVHGSFAQLDSVQLAHNPMAITIAYLTRTFVHDQYERAGLSIAQADSNSQVYQKSGTLIIPSLEVNLERNLEALAKSWSSEHFLAGVLEYLSNAFTGERTWQDCIASLSTYIGAGSAIAFWTSNSSAGELAFQRGAKGASNPRRLDRLHSLAGTAYVSRDAALVSGILRNPKDADLLEEELNATRGGNKSRAIPLTPFVPVNWTASNPGDGVFDLTY